MGAIAVRAQAPDSTIPSTIQGARPGAGFAFTHDSSRWYRLNARYVRSFLPDFTAVASRPAHYNSKNWDHVALVAGGAGLLFLVDKQVYNIMNANRSPFLDEVAKAVEPFGNTYPPLIIGGLYLAGVVTKDRKMEHAALMSAKSMVFSTVFYVTTKQLIRRQRPLYTDYPYNFKPPFSGGKEYTSFPSGHSNTIFTLATALALEYKHKKWVPPLAYSIATLTALSRLYDNRHWSSDVWMGAAIGHFVTRALYYVEEQKARKKELKPLPHW